MRRRTSTILGFLLVPLLAACGQEGATVRLVAEGSQAAALTQALGARSAEDFEAIELRVVEVRVHLSGTEDEADEGWHELVPEEGLPFVLDLRKLLAGERILLAEGELPAGKLTQLRFVLDAKEPGRAILPGDEGDSIPVRVPSGTTSGLKIQGKAVELVEGETRELGLAFDVRASLRDEGDALRIRPVIQLKGVATVPVD